MLAVVGDAEYLGAKMRIVCSRQKGMPCFIIPDDDLHAVPVLSGILRYT
jgi:hypothetical protein